MPLRHHSPQLVFQLFLAEFAFALAHIVLGNHHIHTVGFVADVFVDPVQLLAQLLRIHETGAQHTQATGLADFHHHVAAMGKGEYGHIYAQVFTDFGVHSALLLDLTVSRLNSKTDNVRP
jgi:hypothetical protein